MGFALSGLLAARATSTAREGFSRYRKSQHRKPQRHQMQAPATGFFWKLTCLSLI
jgi:hypothetical protein